MHPLQLVSQPRQERQPQVSFIAKAHPVNPVPEDLNQGRGDMTDSVHVAGCFVIRKERLLDMCQGCFVAVRAISGLACGSRAGRRALSPRFSRAGDRPFRTGLGPPPHLWRRACRPTRGRRRGRLSREPQRAALAHVEEALSVLQRGQRHERSRSCHRDLGSSLRVRINSVCRSDRRWGACSC